MISALKKFARKNEEAKSRAAGAMPAGVSSMGQSLQKKFGRGVQYNMKIIIKGDRNTGKSTLLARFQGKPFAEQYIPTNEIQVCSINWNYRVADDVVKVEVWDVVDKGKKKSESDGLKLANDAAITDDNVLDAEFLNVYKGTHGCIMMLDITKQWTFKYVQRELPKIPENIPVMILANFLDMNEHRVVQLEDITDFIQNLDRRGNTLVEYGECCLKNSFGLKFVHKFFNIPFLTLQREVLEKQLETNKEDMKATVEELSFHRHSEEQNYDKFLTFLEQKSSEKKQVTSEPSLKEDELKSSPSSNLSSDSPKAPSIPKKQTDVGKSKKATQPPSQAVDDFVPGETIDSGFLGNAEKTSSAKANLSDAESRDSNSDNGGNPMVSGFQDISSNEEDTTADLESFPVQKANIIQKDVEIEITSSESESEDEVQTPVVQNQDVEDDEPKATTASQKVNDATNEMLLNDEDNNFMDAWLDSPDTKLPDVKRKAGESRMVNLTQEDVLTVNEPASTKARKTSSDASTKLGNKDDSSEDENEEKKKRHSERKSNNGEEAKEKRRSKHKHKKQSKSKENDESESSERKSKSKKKHRHKHDKSRAKSNPNEKVADYESF